MSRGAQGAPRDAEGCVAGDTVQLGVMHGGRWETGAVWKGCGVEYGPTRQNLMCGRFTRNTQHPHTYLLLLLNYELSLLLVLDFPDQAWILRSEEPGTLVDNERHRPR